MNSAQMPFGLGEFNPVDADGTNAYDALVGHEYWTEDVPAANQGQSLTNRTGRQKKVRLVKNTAAIALLPRRLVQFSTTAPRYGTWVDGYNATLAGHCLPVDEYLPATGAPVNSVFYIVVEGPAEVLTDIAASANNVISVGTVINGLNAASTGATTAGRVTPQDLTGATAPLGNMIQNRIGRALTARTTANTNAAVLVDVGKW